MEVILSSSNYPAHMVHAPLSRAYEPGDAVAENSTRLLRSLL